MKKLLTTLALLLCVLVSHSQQYYKSDRQVIQNATGISTSKNHAMIEFKEPKNVGGDVGYIVISLSEIESSIMYGLQYLKQTSDQDGPILWYYVVNSDSRPEVFNVVKVQKFNKPVLQSKYECSFTLSKYNSNQVTLYEHIYIAKLDKTPTKNSAALQRNSQPTILDVKDLRITKTPEELYKKYGRNNVVVRDFSGQDGDYRNGKEYIIFPNTDNEVAISYKKAYIRFYKNNSRWQLPFGIKVGDNIDEVEKLNKKSFKLYGFEWDNAGLVTDWNKGNLDDKIIITFVPKEEISQDMYEKVTGEIEINSSDNLLRQLKPVVSEIIIKK